MIPFVTQVYGMKMTEAFSYKPPMTAVRSGIKYENGEAIFIGKGDSILAWESYSSYCSTVVSGFFPTAAQ